MRRWLLALGYRVGWAAVRRLPAGAARAAFRLGADLAWRHNGPGARRLAANLRRVVGPSVDDARLRLLVRDGLRSYARYWLEVFRLPVTSAQRVVGGARVSGEQTLRDALAEGRGVVVALPHTGNWDHAGAWAVHVGMPLTTVAERLEPAELFDAFVAYREGLGLEVLPLTGGPRPAFEVLAERLRAGRLVCLLADRDLSHRGVEVSFFAGRTRMPSGPALLALRTGAALVPATLWYAGADWGIAIHAPIPVPSAGRLAHRVAAMTQAVADVFAEAIAAHPQDWHMLQPVWLDELGERSTQPARTHAPAQAPAPAQPAS